MYYLSQVSPEHKSQAVARDAWDAVTKETFGGTQSQETLATYAFHADPVEAQERLTELALAENREDVRFAAVRLIADRIPLAVLLREPPLVTWGVHQLLLDSPAGAPQLATAADIAFLKEVDNVNIAASVARLTQA